MPFTELPTLVNRTGASLGMFAPEVILALTVVAMLLVRLFRAGHRFHASYVAIGGSFLALLAACLQMVPEPPDESAGVFGRLLAWLQQPDLVRPAGFFGGMLVFDEFTIFFRMFLLLFAVLVVFLTMITGIPDREDSPDFYTLMLGATIGMSLMASANHLLMVFLAVEMASVPSYLMAGFLKGRRQSSEASLKYVVYGAGAAGVMLYGISLLAGVLGTAHLPSMAAELAERLQAADGFGAEMSTLVLGTLMVLVGISFKLAAVPFHFWCPDVFEGAAAEVAGFLSVASKGAALGLLVRFALAVGQAPPGVDAESLGSMRLALGAAIAVVAALTATFGNLAAYAQTNLKRLLAYSTIAHAGYMMMPVAAMLTVMGAPGPGAQEAAAEAVRSMLFYLAIYLFMNLAAFAIVAFIRNEIGSEDLADYAGLWRVCPGLTVCMVIVMLSLTGIPPLAGFMAKFQIFAVLYDADHIPLLAIAALNTVFSLFYYVKVLKVMILDAAPEGLVPLRERARLPLWSDAGRYTMLVTAPILVLGVSWDWLTQMAGHVARGLFH